MAKGVLGYSGLPRPEGLIEVDTVLDIGAGLRPIGWYKPKRHICVEPHGPYAEHLRAGGYETWTKTALDALNYAKPEFDAIYMLDSIEHMTRVEGEEVLALALGLKPKQIIVFTPTGYLPQGHDAWEMGGEYWQTHRSGWVPADFPDWAISYPLGPQQFVAVWTA